MIGMGSLGTKSLVLRTKLYRNMFEFTKAHVCVASRVSLVGGNSTIDSKDVAPVLHQWIFCSTILCAH